MTDILSFFVWWLLVTLFGIVSWPLLFRLLRFLPDRGYALAKTAGLLAVGYVGWLLGNFGFIKVDAGGVFAALLIVAALSAVASRGQGAALRAWLGENRITIIAVEVIFLAAFGLWAYSRSLNPAILGTEKPMEFAFLNSVLRTGLQPPGDPWLAGYAISYYHFGYVIMGMLTALSGVQPSVAFNLAIALLFGLTVTGAFGVALNLIATANAMLAKVDPSTDEQKLARRRRRWLQAAILPALLAPVFVMSGNLNGALEVAHKAGLFAATPAETQNIQLCPVDNRYCVICEGAGNCANTDYKSNFWGWLDIKWTNNPPGVPVENEAGGSGLMPDRFLWWWQSSRVVHDRDLFGAETEVIDEFPFFSFLLGDMHPHVLSLPFAFLAVTYALNLFLMTSSGSAKVISGAGTTTWEKFKSWWPLEWPDLLAGAILLGGLSFLNTWDFPIYIFVVVAAYLTARAVRDGWPSQVWRDGAILGGSLAVLGVLLYLPFYIGFRSQLGGILPNVIFGTRVQQFVVMFGPSLFVVLSLLIWYAVRNKTQLRWQGGLALGFGLLVALIAVCAFLAVLIVTVLSGRPDAQAAIDSMIGQASLSDAFGLIMRRRLEIERILTPLLLAGILSVAGAIVFGLKGKPPVTEEAAEPEPAPQFNLAPFIFVLVITGALLTMGPEFVYLRDFFGSRMNTIFKFYYQTWVVWSLASAFGVWWLVRMAQPITKLVFGAGVVVLLGMGLIYPFLATSTITNDGKGNTNDAENQPYATLDGTAYMQRGQQGDYDAIKFLNASIQGRPVISEAVGGSYTEYARVSSHTGLPTIIGWPFHELQWRGNGDVFAGREGDVKTLYTSNDWVVTEQILKKYNVRYVYVGSLEQAQYGALAMEKFDRNLSKIYDNEGVVIYEYKGS